ncbi:MAG: gliding motility lipoprotein GldH [Bacteroidota bacterium]
MYKKQLFSLAAGLLFAGFLVVSCDSSRLYDTFRRIPESGWHADSLMVYRFEVPNTSGIHNIYFNIRNDRNYGFSNLWLFVDIIPPEGEQVTDTIQVILADPSGKWLGKGFSGLYTNQVPYRTQVYFPVQGTYTVQIRHGMRPEVLTGITDIGVRIEHAGVR